MPKGIPKKPRVVVPPVPFAPSVAQELLPLWYAIGGMLGMARRQAGDEVAIGMFLSRVTRELRQLHGIDGAKTILQGYVDSMEEAAKFDDAAP